jgi:hypothetical protein
MVVIRMPDGSTQEFHLRQTPHGLRLLRPSASYDLAAMMAEAEWTIVGVRTEAAKRLLRRVGLSAERLPLLPRHTRWRATLAPNARPTVSEATGLARVGPDGRLSATPQI